MCVRKTSHSNNFYHYSLVALMFIIIFFFRFVIGLIIYRTFPLTLFLNYHLFHEKLCYWTKCTDIHFVETQIISKRFKVNLLNEYVACHSFE